MGSKWGVCGLLVASALVALSLTACGSSGGGGSSTEASGGATAEASSKGTALDGMTVADIANVPNAFITCLQHAYLPRIEEKGASTFTVFGEFQPDGVKRAVEDSITKSPDLALYIGEIPQLDAQAMRELEQAGIPTEIALGVKPEGSDPQGVANFNYETVANETAKAFATLDPEIKKVGILGGIQGVPATDETDRYLETALKREGIEVEDTLYTEYTAKGGATATEDMLQAHPDVQALIVNGDDAGLAATRAIAKVGSDATVATIFGVSQPVIDQVKSGSMLFALYEPVDVWGEQIADMLEEIAAGKTVPDQTLEMELVEKANAGSVKADC